MKLTGISREDLEAKGLVLKNVVDLESKGTAIPDVYSICVGRKNIATDEFESFMVVDEENNTTAEFDKIRDSVTLLEREHTVYNLSTGEEKDVIDYCVPYDIKESSKNKPTVIDDHVEYGYLVGGHYYCEFELMLTCGDATRRIIVPYRTVNMSMIDFTEDIFDEAVEALDEDGDVESIFQSVFEERDGYHTLKMFDEFGNSGDVEINCAEEFTSMIVSIRQIKCEYIDDKEK